MSVFTVHEAKTNLSKLIADATAGGDVVIAKGAVPVVRLVPVDAPRRRTFGALRGLVTIDARFDEPLGADELAAWNGD